MIAPFSAKKLHYVQKYIFNKADFVEIGLRQPIIDYYTHYIRHAIKIDSFQLFQFKNGSFIRHFILLWQRLLRIVRIQRQHIVYIGGQKLLTLRRLFVSGKNIGDYIMSLNLWPSKAVRFLFIAFRNKIADMQYAFRRPVIALNKKIMCAIQLWLIE